MRGFLAAVEARLQSEREAMLSDVRRLPVSHVGREPSVTSFERQLERRRREERIERAVAMRERETPWATVREVLEVSDKESRGFERAVLRRMERRRVQQVRQSRRKEAVHG